MKVYLDNSATTKPRPEVTAFMSRVAEEEYANPSALHGEGLTAEKRVREARRRVAAALGAPADEIVFTSGGTESNNAAVFGVARASRRRGNRIIASCVEHPSVAACLSALADEGFEVVRVPVNANGVISPAAVEAALNEDTILISCMSVNNETGAMQPVAEICALRAAFEAKTGRRVPVHTDAVQAFCKTEAGSPDADLIAISAHKIHGPKGIGALRVRKGLHLRPLICGGGQEGGLRSGTENVPGAAGFGLAVETAARELRERVGRTAALCARLRDGIATSVADIRVNSLEADCVPFILNISFAGVRGEVLLHELERRGVTVSTGAACSSKKRGGSGVLEAMGRTRNEAESAIRFSFGAFNTAEETDYAIDAVREAVARLRAVHALR